MLRAISLTVEDVEADQNIGEDISVPGDFDPRRLGVQ
jgi:hypothetical protein